MIPLNIALTPKRTLLIGAGKVAAQKARVLDSLEFPYEVVAESIFDAYFDAKNLTLKPFDDSDVIGLRLSSMRQETNTSPTALWHSNPSTTSGSMW